MLNEPLTEVDFCKAVCNSLKKAKLYPENLFQEVKIDENPSIQLTTPMIETFFCYHENDHSYFTLSIFIKAFYFGAYETIEIASFTGYISDYKDLNRLGRFALDFCRHADLYVSMHYDDFDWEPYRVTIEDSNAYPFSVKTIDELVTHDYLFDKKITKIHVQNLEKNKKYIVEIRKE